LLRPCFDIAGPGWLLITASEIKLKRIAAIPIARYGYRCSKIPTPGSPSHLTADTVESPLR